MTLLTLKKGTLPQFEGGRTTADTWQVGVSDRPSSTPITLSQSVENDKYPTCCNGWNDIQDISQKSVPFFWSKIAVIFY